MTEWITMDDRTDYRVNAVGDVTVSTIFDGEGSDPNEEVLICQGLMERFGGTWMREGEWNQAGASGEMAARFLGTPGVNNPLTMWLEGDGTDLTDTGWWYQTETMDVVDLLISGTLTQGASRGEVLGALGRVLPHRCLCGSTKPHEPPADNSRGGWNECPDCGAV